MADPDIHEIARVATGQASEARDSLVAMRQTLATDAPLDPLGFDWRPATQVAAAALVTAAAQLLQDAEKLLAQQQQEQD